MYKQRGIPVTRGSIMAAFGCNFEGAIAPETVRDCVGELLKIADEFGVTLDRVRLADTVGWASPAQVQRVVGMVREKWPDLRLGLHLHDTRGTGMANALMGLQMGIESFDSSCAGLGGCPFAPGASGNVATEDLVYMLESMGYRTGVDLDKLLAVRGILSEGIPQEPLYGYVAAAGIKGADCAVATRR